MHPFCIISVLAVLVHEGLAVVHNVVFKIFSNSLPDSLVGGPPVCCNLASRSGKVFNRLSQGVRGAVRDLLRKDLSGYFHAVG